MRAADGLPSSYFHIHIIEKLRKARVYTDVNRITHTLFNKC